jgi:hypothetical protein
VPYAAGCTNNRSRLKLKYIETPRVMHQPCFLLFCRVSSFLYRFLFHSLLVRFVVNVRWYRWGSFLAPSTMQNGADALELKCSLHPSVRRRTHSVRVCAFP